jgi:amino acid adenylation domain-containing protein
MMKTVLKCAPLSSMQQAMLSASHLEEQAHLYCNSLVFRLWGPLNRTALAASIRRVVSNHEALRTSFPIIDGAVVQQIWEEPSDGFLEILNVDGAEISDEEAQLIVKQQTERRFDFENGPLARFVLVEQRKDVNLLILSAFHGIVDGWSVSLFFEEVCNCYSEFLEGGSGQLAQPSHHYSDYAAAERAWLESNQGVSALEFWKSELQNPPGMLQYAGSSHRERPDCESQGEVTCWIESNMFERVVSMSGSLRATPFMTLLSAFVAVLPIYFENRDVIVSTVTAGRGDPGFERTIGCCMNTVPLRIECDKRLTFKDLVAKVRSTCVRALDHAKVPFARIVREIQPQRRGFQNALSQVMFSLRKQSLVQYTLRNIRLESVQVKTRGARADLFFDLEIAENRICVSVEYSKEFTDEKTVRRLLRNYVSILANALDDPNRSLLEISKPLPEDEALVAQWGRCSRVSEIPRQCVHCLVESQAVRTPDAHAIEHFEGYITYAQMNAEADFIARRLRDCGVAREDVVAVCGRRSPMMIITLLAILKAGAAYLPLNPDDPPSRVADVVAGAAAKVIVSIGGFQDKLMSAGAPILEIDPQYRGSEGRKAEFAAMMSWDCENDPDNLAYVIFTSGSTGKPKGVEVPHRALSNVLISFQRDPGFAAADRMLWTTNLSFDIAALEIFLPLISGGTVIVSTSDVSTDAFALAEDLEKYHPTFVQGTPTMWRCLVDSGWAGNTHGRVLSGGESLSEALSGELRKRAKEVWNVYGPSETTVWSTAFRQDEDTRISIGKPIANTRIYILDDDLDPVHVGALGELYIAGAGLARGYLSQPQTTAERFIPDPFFQGERMYRTGDLARWVDPGILQFHGRNDSTVKLRGIRIDLGEIETTIRQLPQIGGAAVVLDKQSDENARLVAYVIPYPGVRVDRAILLRQLEERLPRYMIPAKIIELARFPLTVGGKLDRTKLPKADWQSPDEVRSLERAPQTETEQKLSEIWRNVLERPDVQTNQSFFDLGGHSLLATKIIVRVRTEFSVDVTVSDLFDGPSVSAFAKRVDAARLIPDLKVRRRTKR